MGTTTGTSFFLSSANSCLFWGKGSLPKIDDRTKIGYQLILTSLLEDLGKYCCHFVQGCHSFPWKAEDLRADKSENLRREKTIRSDEFCKGIVVLQFWVSPDLPTS